MNLTTVTVYTTLKSVTNFSRNLFSMISATHANSRNSGSCQAFVMARISMLFLSHVSRSKSIHRIILLTKTGMLT